VTSESIFSKKSSLILLLFSIIVLDQLSKYLASKSSLQFNCNRGIAFGLGQDAALISPVVLLVIFWLLAGEKSSTLKLGFLMIFAGGLSNFIDRIFVGCVRDFIMIGRFPSFNLADLVITLGAAISVWYLLRSQIGTKNES